MGRWVNGAVIAVAVLLGFSGLPVLGQGEVVDLQFSLARGEALFYTVTGGAETVIVTPEARQTTQARVEGRLAIRVLDVDASGVMLAESVSEDLRVTAGGTTEEPIDDPIVVKVRPDGRVVDRVIGAEGLEDFPNALPGRAVRVGDSWTRPGTVSFGGFTHRGTVTLTLDGIDRAGAQSVARVRYRLEGPAASAAPSQTQTRVTGTIRLEGEFHWSVERRRPLRESSRIALDVESEGLVQRQPVRARVTALSTVQQELIATPGAPQVPADQLIVPGRAIGAISLDMPVSEINTRLGNPEALPEGLGFRARGLAWRNTMVGFVDPTNPGRLIGLDVSLRRHRTSRGIGFGSSEGAVLFAYGPSPIRLDMTIPQTGGVRVLIYNDLGIAFALTSDRAHAELGPEHAPIGAVDWITIFPPGGAGRIYPIP
ncbi:MAG: hypothetical protein ACT4PY_10125 [Armatimonadota bacterium]